MRVREYSKGEMKKREENKLDICEREGMRV